MVGYLQCIFVPLYVDYHLGLALVDDQLLLVVADHAPLLSHDLVDLDYHGLVVGKILGVAQVVRAHMEFLDLDYLRIPYGLGRHLHLFGSRFIHLACSIVAGVIEHSRRQHVRHPGALDSLAVNAAAKDFI